MSNLCPVCDRPLFSEKSEPPDRIRYTCPHCGDFKLSGTLVETLPDYRSKDPDAGAKLSHAIRRAHETQKIIYITDEMAKTILKYPLPRPREQADLLIRWLANNVPGPGETVKVEYKTHGAIIGSKSAAGFELVLDHLFKVELVAGMQHKTLQHRDCADVMLSFDGWEYYEKLKSGGAKYRKAFMAMKFGDPQLDKVLETVFKPSAKRAGFDLFKLNDVPKAGLIDDRLRVDIQASDFVVVDLTHDNPGAYWEAGYAEGLGKPVIYTCKKSKFDSDKTHFDTNHHLTICWDENVLEQAGEELTATIRATLPHVAVLVDEGE